MQAQRLLLLIHAARNGPSRAADVQNAWTNATAEERAGVSALAHELEAEVALAAATGHIGEYSDRREHDLWRLLAEGGAGKFEIWIARTKSAATVAERLHVMASPFRLKTDSVALALGRQPTTREILRAYGNRLRLNIASAWVVARQAASRRPPGLPASHRDATDTRLP